MTKSHGDNRQSVKLALMSIKEGNGCRLMIDRAIRKQWSWGEFDFKFVGGHWRDNRA